jgi:beta-galactosidase
MIEMGCNAIRTAHNPPSPEQLELCDELGLLVIDETFDEWTVAKMPNGYNKLFDEWAEKDTRALLLRDRNHPSIIMWSIGNEIRKLDSERGKMNAQRLVDICHELDPTRPVIAGIHLSTKIDKDLIRIFDVIGLNYWQDRYEKLHQEFPGIKLLSTESAAVLSTRGEYHFPVERIYRNYKHESLQISSYDLINTGFGALPDVEFKLQEDLPYMIGEFVWSGFDYHGEPDPYEDMWPAHSSYFGIVDMCGFPKDRYYLYQSQWSDVPMVHLLPHWNWKGREGEITPVYCYTNCDAVELFVNGKSFGKKSKNTGEYRLKWDDVTYQPGSIKAVAYDMNGNFVCEKEITTAGEPRKIKLSVDRETILADGEDIGFVTVQITDQNGNFCPLADNLISFTTKGEGKILCVGNGNPISLESYQTDKRKAFNGLCLVLVQSTKNEGDIRLTATSPGLEEQSIVFNSQN